MAHSGASAGMGDQRFRPHTIAPPRKRPLRPPISVSVEASTRNCQRMSRRLAPIDLRSPISRVRSVTEIIMIPITPTPPTIRPTLERATITVKSTPVS